MKCPTDGTKITTKHYDADYEWYECPKCQGCFTADELEESETGTSPRKRAEKAAPKAKGKKRLEEISEDEKAVKEFEEKAYAVRASSEPKATRHRDQVRTGEILNIVADEIEGYCREVGTRIDRINAREFYAMNLVRPMVIAGVSAREQTVPMMKCGDHE